MDKILLDTDVILDFFFDREPFAENAAQIISLCERKEIDAFITPVICSNLYYLLRQNSTHAFVIKQLKQLLSIVDIIPIDKNVIFSALESGFKDFKDAIQSFAAVQWEGMQLIVSRNIKDFSKSEIPAMTPEHFLKARTLQ
ncbi:MAG: PIN domain-containing protein [Bacteroidales bacterium]|nr:PIN domain-containing protein [Bacteroidales bacterium]